MLARWHRYLGVVAATWLVAATFSGALLLWKDDYFRWRYPVLAAPAQQPTPSALASAQTATPTRIRVMVMPTESLPAIRAYLVDGAEALLDPATGDVLATMTALDSLPMFLFDLHAHLLLGSRGKTLTGIMGLLAIFNIATGCVLWMKRRGVYSLRYLLPRDFSRSRVSRAHAAQGAVLALLLAGLLLTGIALVFPGPAQKTLDLLLGSSGVVRPVAGRIAGATARVNWKAALTTANREFPLGTIRLLSPPRGAGAPLVIRIRNHGELHPNGRSYLVLHPQTGDVIERIDATTTGAGPAAFNALYPLHSGKTGWTAYRFLLTALCLGLVFIAASGLYLAATRPGKPARRRGQ